MAWKNNKKIIEEYLIKLNEFKFDFSLKRIKACLKLLNNPQNSYQVIHVAGSNGKGSVCVYLANIFKEHGYKTGLYTSPHLKDITERISVNDKPVSVELFYSEAIKLRNLIEKNKIELTYFEFLTALAFVIFKKQKIDIAVIETGLGGRLDATNVDYKRKFLNVITSIALEHTDWLGKTETSILNEKEQIIGNGQCVSGIKQADLRAHLVKKYGERIIFNDMFYSMSIAERVNNILNIDYKDISNNIIIRLKTKMTESIQAENIRTVLTCLKVLEKSGFKFDMGKVSKAIYKTMLPGRLSYNKKGYYISVAHNYEAIDEMLASLKNIAQNREIVYIFSVLKDKDMDAIAKVMKKYGNLQVIITQIHNNARALSIGKIRDYIVKYKIRYSMEPDNKAALRKAMRIKGKGVVVVGGSFYLAKEYV
jgi:dihydrofolate synthase/folylpolyglutamate synthase